MNNNESTQVTEHNGVPAGTPVPDEGGTTGDREIELPQATASSSSNSTTANNNPPPSPTPTPGTPRATVASTTTPSTIDNVNATTSNFEVEGNASGSNRVSTSNLPPSSRNNSIYQNGTPAPFSIGGIESDESDDEYSRFKKGKKKERTHSKIVLQHKKNLLGQIIYKGHPSWVLMLNIQTGIRNAVGKSMHQSRSFLQVPRNLTQTRSSPQPPPPTQAAPLPQSISQPVINNNTLQVPSPSNGQPSPSDPPPALQYHPSGILGPEQFEKIAEFYASPRVLQFPSAGSSQTIPHQTGPFKFKDYCSHAFRFLRHQFGIDPADYMVSLCNTQKNGENALRELPTPGKSGSLFFFSHDMRFILKTIPKSEAKLLRYLLPSYVEHVAHNKNTLLPKFFGLHRVKPHRGRQVRFVVMGNVFQTKKKIHERYDLKGSTLGRAASEEEKKKDTVTYKDLDFRERHMKIQIGPMKRAELIEQLQKDCKFLGQLNIMDYSFLIGIHYEDREEGERSPPPSPIPIMKSPSAVVIPPDYFQSIFQSNDGGTKAIDEAGNPLGRYYYMGVIDILMLYSVRKKIEHTYKTLRYKKEGEEISSISPPEYATRFYEFISASVV